MHFPTNRDGLNRSITLLLLLATCGTCAICQDAGPANIVPRIRTRPEHEPPTIRSDVKMVLIPASVIDQDDRPVLNLRKEDFHLFEDAIEQRIETLSLDDAPVSLGLVFDSSGSMTNKIDKSFKAVDQFLRTSQPGDEYFLLQFSDAPELKNAFTPHPDEIMNSLRSIKPQGWTALYDAMYIAVQRMRSAKNPRKVLLVLSDGVDNNSRYTDSEIISLLREADVRVYAIGLLNNARFLKKAAAETGGRVVVVHNTEQLPKAIDTLSRQLRSEYLIGYYPTHGQNDGKFHNVKVQLFQRLRNGFHTSWRHGYYAPF